MTGAQRFDQTSFKLPVTQAVLVQAAMMPQQTTAHWRPDAAMERHPVLKNIHVIERGWLSSNNVLIDDGVDAALIDSGYVSHAEQTDALVRRALGGRRLTRLINTHLHSDHCGGNAKLQRTHDCEIWIPPGQWSDVLHWDTEALGFGPTGQRCDRFEPDHRLMPGSSFELGGRPWSVMSAPGHDPHSLILFDARDGVLITADALWENGFGIVFPELCGVSAFDEVGVVLDLIESFDAKVIIPGHGRPFTDIQTALARARDRLKAFVADPTKHARHAAKVLIKFRLMEIGSESEAALLAWGASLPYLRVIHQRYFASQARRSWVEQLVAAMCVTGALRREGIHILNI